MIPGNHMVQKEKNCVQDDLLYPTLMQITVPLGPTCQSATGWGLPTNGLNRPPWLMRQGCLGLRLRPALCLHDSHCRNARLHPVVTEAASCESHRVTLETPAL